MVTRGRYAFVKGNQDGESDNNSDNEADAGNADVNGDTDAVTESDTPKGTLPQTGEEAPASPIIGWLLCAAGVALWYVRKRNKRDAA
ncbi:LPXTG cell wall anchor domain-containing protein [Paenibacillus apiarius]|uniref:LPXTG cell wall anchor domain-containing protein n=1 Tax=Paenibacillus apiarius TaxID=46240 RepID=UPI001980C775|nr:LPXTG cell wall anchor domain-containing protein [Paenibacillus apiarius]MBN3524848.1 LPXTG cell wall anchor domain-containing protein [Paenibacillus apiarius]